MDFENKKYQEHYCISKPLILAKNIIFGGLYIDVDGETEALNVNSGEKVVVKHYVKTKNHNSYIHGMAYNS